MFRFLCSALLLLAFLLPTAPAWAADPPEAERLFVLQVQPLLARKCFGCHGGDRQKVESGLDLTSRQGMLRGGELYPGEVLVPGNAEGSYLYRVVVDRDAEVQMPPKETERLTQEEAWAIRDWINAGAPWPEPERVREIRRRDEKGVVVPTSGGLSPPWDQRRYLPENLWAYQPIARVVPPQMPGGTPANPIDAFILARLREAGLEPAPRADRLTLIRRATFDLLGLPPSPEEIDRFVHDPAPDAVAWQRLVDRLLASPHYGEQWARHWLDLVRYADTAGFANDYERPNAWRYRDYVIRSLNRDKPYDQFVREQIAGDEIDPDNPEMLIAVGMLRMGPWEQTGMSVARVTRQQYLDDITDMIGQAFLAHPLQCARCHDHKFDPIPTRDYYRIQAVFATTQMAERPAPFLPEENRNGFEQERAYLQHRIARYEGILAGIQAKHEEAARKWYAERGIPYAPRNELLKRGVPEDQIAPRHLGLDVEDFGLERIARKYLTRHRWELEKFEPVALSVYSGKTRLFPNVQGPLRMPEDPLGEGILEQTRILQTGNLFAPLDPVQPGVLSCLAAFQPESQEFVIPDGPQGRRLAFARWLTSPTNPLFVRSIVNRVWHHHFGRGIARNLNNFGATGAKPTHPELLDWLCGWFIRHGWSLKQLHRLIMLSDTYCRASVHPEMERVLQEDPEGQLYAVFYPRRLAAEETRDAVLAASGQLNLEMGGIPVRPDIHPEVALQPRQIMGTYAPAYQPSPYPWQRNRRSIYAMKIRGLRDPFMEVFNQPDPDRPCEFRDASTITPQVLALWNGRTMWVQAIAMAQRLLREAATDRHCIRLAFRYTCGREPSEEELQWCLEHWQEMTRLQEEASFPDLRPPRVAVRQAVEEMSGETFEFVEELESAGDYVPDVDPARMDARQRALADVCLVLLNGNEFLYVR